MDRDESSGHREGVLSPISGVFTAHRFMKKGNLGFVPKDFPILPDPHTSVPQTPDPQTHSPVVGNPAKGSNSDHQSRKLLSIFFLDTTYHIMPIKGNREDFEVPSISITQPPKWSFIS